ncbi:OLC1v1022915C3 [Oldenlandia corymbosa var. corymbosa]|nr:OLC1v1022915C3 [Oldenlandia corymbosa var. corymbosa]
MASINSLATPQTFLSIVKPKPRYSHQPKPSTKLQFLSFPCNPSILRCRKDSNFIVGSLANELDVIPVQSNDYTDQPDVIVVGLVEIETEGVSGGDIVNQVVNGFGNEERLSFEGATTSSSGYTSGGGGGGGGGFGGSGPNGEAGKEGQEMDKLIDSAINASIVLAAGTFAITKLLTIDSDYWHGWTIYEILRYAPEHNWSAYEEALKTNPVFAKMVISGVVYSVGDWIAQCYEGKPIFGFDRARMLRSGLVGFTLHGSLSHYYYQFCEALFPFDDWWVVPAKVAFDQTFWSAVWNSIYYTVVAVLRLESPVNIFNELKATFWPMLTAGWKLWPFAHLITYGVIPVEQRLLWVDCVELIWVTILST